MLKCFLVGVGGFIGAVLRYLLCLIPGIHGLPVMTLIVNIAAAVIIGAVSEFAEKLSDFPPDLNLFLTTGFCGGFSTLSALSLETVELFEGGRGLIGSAYVILSVALCLAGVFIGRIVAAAVIAK